MFELNKHTIEILGKPNFTCAAHAQLFRLDGQAIPYKAEAEQAAVIYWLLCVYEEHGDKWREVAGSKLDEMIKRVKEKSEAKAVSLPAQQNEP